MLTHVNTYLVSWSVSGGQRFFSETQTDRTTHCRCRVGGRLPILRSTCSEISASDVYEIPADYWGLGDKNGACFEDSLASQNLFRAWGTVKTLRFSSELLNCLSNIVATSCNIGWIWPRPMTPERCWTIDWFKTARSNLLADSNKILCDRRQIFESN